MTDFADDDFMMNTGTPDADWWKTKAGPELFAVFKRHPITLMWHPEVYEPGEREQIKKELLAAAGTPTAATKEVPNGGYVEKEKVMSTETKTIVTREEHRGTACIYADPRGKQYAALITEVWGPQCVNVVYVNDVDGQSDSYGQKLVRATSVMHGSIQQAHGNYWMLPGEVRAYVPQPVDSADPNSPPR